MSSPIRPLGSIDPAIIQVPGQVRRPGGFESVLEAAIGRVEQLRTQADGAVQSLLAGESEELHGTVLAAQRAELAFELFLQMRNKVVQAYQEIMRLQM